MAAAPTTDDVFSVLGEAPTEEETAQCAAVLNAVSAFALRYTRGAGVAGDVWDGGLRALVVTATARWVKNPTGETSVTDTAGPYSTQTTNAAPAGFTALEWTILNTLRARTNRPKGA